MRARHLFNPISPVFRRFQGLCAVVVYLVALIGLPVPQSSHAASDSAYPCQHGRCGCATADQCWRSCCCHTLEQRVAWAREHGVTPPDFVLKQLAEKASIATESQHGSCCEDSTARESCCAADAPKVAASSKGPENACCSDANTHSPSEQPAAPATPWVTLIDAAKCQGLQSLWIALGAVISPPAKVDFVCELAPAGFVSPALQMRYEVSFSPSPPVPRV